MPELLPDVTALNAIQMMLETSPWNDPETVEGIADLVNATGRTIRRPERPFEIDLRPEWEREPIPYIPTQKEG